MPVLILETPEATFMNDMRRDQHFMIDCACKGKEGQYHGSHYKNGTEEEELDRRTYEPLEGRKSEHTFYLSLTIFQTQLELREAMKESPLVIVCNDCAREFPFTLKSFWALDNRMRQEYNRRIEEEESRAVS